MDILQDKAHQLYSVLMQATEGVVNDIVCNSSADSLESWEGLARKWDLLTNGRIRNLLRSVTLPKLQGALERWKPKREGNGKSKDKSKSGKLSLKSDGKSNCMGKGKPKSGSGHPRNGNSWEDEREWQASDDVESWHEPDGRLEFFHNSQWRDRSLHMRALATG